MAQTTRQGGPAATPAQVKNSAASTTRSLSAHRQIFAWQSSEQNHALAAVAQEETDCGYEVIIETITGLQVSQMYAVLAKALTRELKRAASDEEQAFALATFAARCYRAGRYEGSHAEIGGGE